MCHLINSFFLFSACLHVGKTTDFHKHSTFLFLLSLSSDENDEWIVFVMQVVLTKVDKCGHRTLLTNLLDLQEVINKHTTSCFPQPFLVRWELHVLQRGHFLLCNYRFILSIRTVIIRIIWQLLSVCVLLLFFITHWFFAKAWFEFLLHGNKMITSAFCRLSLQLTSFHGDLPAEVPHHTRNRKY